MKSENIPAWDNGILRPVNKLEAHQKGLKHKAVSVFLLSDNQLLIQRRALNKYHTPGLWANTCCTHPHWDENTEICAVRRLNEELGIKFSQLKYKNKIDYKANVGNGLIENESVDIYVGIVEQKSSLIVEINSYEVMDTKWIDIDELKNEIQLNPTKFTPWIRIYMQKHLGQILQ
jgi:isopentenyl-diphosphate delta-isomerase